MIDPIAAHVAELDRGLYGPTRLRDDLLRELREGLEDAAAAYRATGVDRRRAGELAVRDFGPTVDIADQLQGELAAAQARRTVLLLAVAFPALLIGWDLVWSSGIEWGPGATAGVRLLAVAQDVTSGLVAVASVGLLLLGLRRATAPRAAVLAAGLTALGAVTLTCVFSVSMALPQATEVGMLIGTRPSFVVVSALSAVALTAMSLLGLRTVATARRRPGADR